MNYCALNTECFKAYMNFRLAFKMERKRKNV